jgi:DNA-binding Lrp family transcriptional regulator
MIAAVVLINTERGRIAETAEALLAIPDVAEVYSVAGEYDLVAIVRVRAYEQMAEVVPTRLAGLPTITRTQTLMAFQCYSRRDLERMWGIGLDDESELGEPPTEG